LVYPACLLMLFSSMGTPSLSASSYMNLTPGYSTKEDADRVLGMPVKEMAQGRCYDYQPEPHEASRVSVSFKPDTHVIEGIDIYFRGEYHKAQLKEWLGLGEPAATGIDAEGNFFEAYKPEGISLHFAGKDDAACVRYYKQFDPDDPQAIPKRVFLGVWFEEHGGEGITINKVFENTPAARAGLRAGDIILEMGDNTFYGKKIDPREGIDLIATLPARTPVRFVIQRNGARLDAMVTLEEAQ